MRRWLVPSHLEAGRTAAPQTEPTRAGTLIPLFGAERDDHRRIRLEGVVVGPRHEDIAEGFQYAYHLARLNPPVTFPERERATREGLPGDGFDDVTQARESLVPLVLSREERIARLPCSAARSVGLMREAFAKDPEARRLPDGWGLHRTRQESSILNRALNTLGLVSAREPDRAAESLPGRVRRDVETARAIVAEEMHALWNGTEAEKQ